ncbi:hypothetical protein HYDPIDRAFT_27415 [Hydnomerulius pinastri MD-312]|nr:hypothetical protein HYDPIDRAFT_27415 [Hydnomerulius pinastri MD-312]
MSAADIELEVNGGSSNVASEDLPPPRLKSRHVQMIAIAGTLGTGLFLGSGQAISSAGPVGALIAYILVGTVAYASLCSVGEMTSFAPIHGSFPYYASRWVDEALGFAVGWNYFYTNAMTLPVEISGAQLLITYWDDNKKHGAAFVAIMCGAACLINIFGVRYFGEAEFVFSILKCLILVGIVIDLGGVPGRERLGFRYWKDPGPFTGPQFEPDHPGWDHFLGIMSAIVVAAFSFQGIEIAAIAAAETESPRRNVAKAIWKAFFRILLFYIFGVFVAGLIVSSDNPSLLQSSGDAAQGNVTASPYVIAMGPSNSTNSTISGLPGVVNAGMIASAFSAGNSFLYSASRILSGLALRGQAPKLFVGKKDHVPTVAVLFTSAFGLLSFLSFASGPAVAFKWLISLSAVGEFFTWATINFTYLFFFRGLKYQEYDREEWHYRNILQPWLAIWGLLWCIIFILISGYQVFWHFIASTFFTSYIGILLFFGLYAFWKVSKKTRVWRVDEMNFKDHIPSYDETELEYRPPTSFWGKMAGIVF